MDAVVVPRRRVGAQRFQSARRPAEFSLANQPQYCHSYRGDCGRAVAFIADDGQTLSDR